MEQDIENWKTSVSTAISSTFGDLRQFYISVANMSGKDQDIDKRKTALSTTIPPTLQEKTGELWSTNNKVYMANYYTSKINFFRRHYFGP